MRGLWQVWDLSDGGPKAALSLFRSVPGLRVLACGGDGTIGWVGQEMRSAGLAPGALLVPVPMGTGNDFARALGWGGGVNINAGNSVAVVGQILASVLRGCVAACVTFSRRHKPV